ncbi:hypothetical protein MYIN104542_12920 [Mycobacterium intermedium]
MGCRTAVRALQGWLDGVVVSRGEAEPAGICRRAEMRAEIEVEIEVYVVAEVLKPEDHDALTARPPVLVLLNKADLTGFGCPTGPLGAARARCEQLAERAGLPVAPLIGLLAVAAFDDLDDACWAALRALAAHPDGGACLDRSFAGFLAADLPVATEVRQRLLDSLDVFGIALVVAALRRGAGQAEVRALLRRVSGVDGVTARIRAAGAEVRYRRVLEAVRELEALAVTQPEIGDFLRSDEAVLARMAAAADVVHACGLELGPDEPLGRAVRWQRYSRESVNELHRACGTDISRGALRLWSRKGGGMVSGKAW